jgi:divalent metal cation (Fe/Co/Zn/Cd) transporter
VAGAILMALAVYIVVDAGRRLLGFGEEARESWLGIALTAVSLIVMPVLG